MSQQKVFKSCEQFVFSIYKSLENQPNKLQAFTSLFQSNKKSNNNLLESQKKLFELIQDHPDLIEQLNNLLPEDLKIPKSNLQVPMMREQEEEPNQIQKIFAELQSRRPDKVQSIIELISAIRNNKNRKNIEGLKDKLAKILEDEPNLLNMFMKYLRQFLEEATMVDTNEAEPSREESLSAETPMDIEENDDLRVRNRGSRGAAGRGFGRSRGKGRRGGIRRAGNDVTQPSSPTTAPAITLPVTVRNELNLFENLRTSLSKGNYNQLIKLVYLYTECIIGANEVVSMVKPLFKGNDNYTTLFQEVIFAREKARRKNTTLFKPFSEVDFESKFTTKF